MKKLLNSLKYVKLVDFLSPFIFIFALIPAMILKLLNKIMKRELWLVCENGETARDNGYHFYKYIKEKHTEKNCFYVIKKNSYDVEKVRKYGNIIEFKSFKHWIYYLAAKYNISNHKNGNPNQIFFYIIHVILGLFNNRVFLQHGITKDNAEWLYYKNTKFRFFICGAKKEYEYIKSKFGYPEKNLIYTGFPRFDNLHNMVVNKKQILIMPTWRNWLGRETNGLSSEINFSETQFCIKWNELLTNKKLIDFIEKNDFKIIFYPHINMQKYINDFKCLSQNIKVLCAKDVDIQELLKESNILITDYSSVFMDFAYMTKGIIFYQFDYEEYREKQYQNGYFDYKNDGFGPVFKDSENIVSAIIKQVNYGVDEVYIKKMKAFFEIRDCDNSNRIYNILNCSEEKK